MQNAQLRAADRTRTGSHSADEMRVRPFPSVPAVVFLHDRSPPLDHRPLDLDRAGGGGVDRAAVAGEIELRPLRLRQLQHAHEHGRHELAVRYPAPFGSTAALPTHRSAASSGPFPRLAAHSSEKIKWRGVIHGRRGKINGIGAETVHPARKRRTRYPRRDAHHEALASRLSGGRWYRNCTASIRPPILPPSCRAGIPSDRVLIRGPARDRSIRHQKAPAAR